MIFLYECDQLLDESCSFMEGTRVGVLGKVSGTLEVSDTLRSHSI